MGIFSRNSDETAPSDSPSTDQIVRDFLRGQNLEQVGRIDEAIALYEQAVTAKFDAAGPYDRLIFIYQGRRQHQDVIRVARASLASVRTYPEKSKWYETRIEEAEKEARSAPKPL
ncbi:MAG: hypothetical protein KY429_03070 [Actinobacteria bacterium]|nr:hypothetical protein [Actinomycetota bacterium]